MDDIQQQACFHLLQILLREELVNLASNPKEIRLNDRSSLFIDHCARYDLNLFEIHSDTLLYKAEDNKSRKLEDYQELLRILGDELNIPKESWGRFTKEYDNHVRNLRLTLKKTKHTFVHEGFCEEQVPFGHPHHPCAKTKLGFSAEEVLAYSPEFKPIVPIYLAAISPSILHIETSEKHLSYLDWFKKSFPTLSLNFMPDGFIPIFIHPWQMENIIKKKFSDLLGNGALIVSTQIAPMIPTLSFRTLVPIESALPCHIKLPVAIQSTSAIRTVSAGACENGPKMSAILRVILENEKLDRDLTVMSEIFGLHLEDKDPEKKRHLSMIVRENKHQSLPNNQRAIMIAALLGKQINHEKTLFSEVLESAAIRNPDQAKHYFKRYCQIALRPCLDLYLLSGIALESHQQNTIMIFKEGWPEHLICRDLGGIRVDLPSLKSYGYSFTPYPDSATFIYDRRETLNKLLHTVYQSHLGEIILALSKIFNTPSKEFWRIVREITLEAFEELKPRLSPENYKLDQERILQKSWPLKALFKMRLANVSQEYIYLEIKNPLVGN